MKKLFLFLVLIALGTELFAVTPPPKPTRSQIAKDLVGHRLKEGKDDGWFPNDWSWLIEEGEIKAMKIEEVLKDTDSDYCINVVMRLESDKNAFIAKAKINYILTRDKKWRLEYVISKGMNIVKTHKYDDCLNVSIDKRWFMGVNVNNEKEMTIENNCEIFLYFAGYIYMKSGEKQKLTLSIGPHNTEKIPYVEAYEVVFIERY